MYLWHIAVSLPFSLLSLLSKSKQIKSFLKMDILSLKYGFNIGLRRNLKEGSIFPMQS